MKSFFNEVRNEMCYSGINCDVLELVSISFILVFVNVEF